MESLSPRQLWLVGIVVSAGAMLAVGALAAAAVMNGPYWVGWRPVLLAAAVAAVVPMVGLWPLAACDPADSKGISKAAYSGTPIRMVTAALLAAPAILCLPDKTLRVAFAIWLVGLYLVSLMAETIVLAAWLRGRGGVTRA